MRSAKLKTPISNLKRQETDRPAPADVSMLRQTLSDLIVANSHESFFTNFTCRTGFLAESSSVNVVNV